MKRHRGPSGYHDEVFHDDDHVVRTLTKILDDAVDRRTASSTRPRACRTRSSTTAPGCTSCTATSSRGGHVMVNIRKFTGVAFRDLDELVERDMLRPRRRRLPRAPCVRARPLDRVRRRARARARPRCCRAARAELDPSLRVVIAEEVFEADVPVANVASMQTRAGRADRPAVDLRRLVAGFLRMAPDVAIVGEVRDREALPLLLTLSSGVKGFTTIHAGSARQALTRLRFICQLADVANELPMSALNTLVSEAIDLVVHCRPRPATGPGSPRSSRSRTWPPGPSRPVHVHRAVRPRRRRRPAMVRPRPDPGIGSIPPRGRGRPLPVGIIDRPHPRVRRPRDGCPSAGIEHRRGGTRDVDRAGAVGRGGRVSVDHAAPEPRDRSPRPVRSNAGGHRHRQPVGGLAATGRPGWRVTDPSSPARFSPWERSASCLGPR